MRRGKVGVERFADAFKAVVVLRLERGRAACLDGTSLVRESWL